MSKTQAQLIKVNFFIKGMLKHYTLEETLKVLMPIISDKTDKPKEDILELMSKLFDSFNNKSKLNDK